MAANTDINPHPICNCAIICQQLILRDYCFYIAEEDLRTIGKNNGWYQESVGVFMRDNGKLLGCFGVKYHHQQHNTIDDIISELRSNHRVMVNLNIDKMHDGPNVSYNNHVATHSVLVNDVDTDNALISLTDPMGLKNKICPLDWFLYAWQDSVCYMLATDLPACNSLLTNIQNS